MSNTMNFFKEEGGIIRFVGTKLEIFISLRFENHKCLKVTNSLTTIGIFDMLIDSKHEDSFFAPTIIEMLPSYTEQVTIGDKGFLKATFLYGDIFIKNTEVQQIQDLGYVIFYEVINCANRSKHLDYFKGIRVFDKMSELCGIDFNINKKVEELIWAHIHRDANNLNTFYRQTEMKEPPTIIEFKDIAHGTVTTTGKIIGNYFNDSLRSAIVNPSEESSDIENILRA